MSFAADVWPILEDKGCNTCHADDTYHPGFLLIDAPTAYTTLTEDEPDDSSTHSSYVVAGDADGSLLVDKISNDPPDYGGSVMPNSDNTMSEDQVETVSTWIDEGALDN